MLAKSQVKLVNKPSGLRDVKLICYRLKAGLTVSCVLMCWNKYYHFYTQIPLVYINHI